MPPLWHYCQRISGTDGSGLLSTAMVLLKNEPIRSDPFYQSVDRSFLPHSFRFNQSGTKSRCRFTR